MAVSVVMHIMRMIMHLRQIMGRMCIGWVGWVPLCPDDATAVFHATHAYTLFLQDNSAPVTIRTRKFTTNRLLSRKQFIVDVIHPSRPPISRTELSEKLAALYKADKNRVIPFGFKTHFGGGRSTGFALIYDDEESQKKFEPKYRLVRVSDTFLLLLVSFRSHISHVIR
jgi:small subunit ribosomal protein S24e